MGIFIKHETTSPYDHIKIDEDNKSEKFTKTYKESKQKSQLEIIISWLEFPHSLIKFISAVGLIIIVLSQVLMPHDWFQPKMKVLRDTIKNIISVEEINLPNLFMEYLGFINRFDDLTEADIKINNVEKIYMHEIKSNEASPSEDIIRKAHESITTAKNELEKQANAVKEVSLMAGAQLMNLKTGWIYLGLYDKNNELRVEKSLNERIKITPQIKNLPKKLDELYIVLLHDTVFTSTPGDCNTVKMSEISMPDPNSAEPQFSLVKASDTTLHVRNNNKGICSTKVDPDLKTVFIEIDIPTDRVRFAQLSTIKK